MHFNMAGLTKRTDRQLFLAVSISLGNQQEFLFCRMYYLTKVSKHSLSNYNIQNALLLFSSVNTKQKIFFVKTFRTIKIQSVFYIFIHPFNSIAQKIL